MYGIWFLVVDISYWCIVFGQKISSICHRFSFKNVVALVHNAIVYGFVIFHCCQTHFGLQVVNLFTISLNCMVMVFYAHLLVSMFVNY